MILAANPNKCLISGQSGALLIHEILFPKADAAGDLKTYFLHTYFCNYS